MKGGFRDGERGVYMIVAYEKKFPAEENSRMLTYALTGVGSEAGLFKEVRVATLLERACWTKAVEAVKALGLPQEEDDDSEPAILAGKAKIYRVRTALSRYVFKGADCVIAFGDRHARAYDAKLIREQEPHIVKAIDKMNLPKRNCVWIQHGGLPRDPEQLKSFDEANEALLKRLGFSDRSIAGY
jgi:hypothetical protein